MVSIRIVQHEYKNEQDRTRTHVPAAPGSASHAPRRPASYISSAPSRAPPRRQPMACPGCWWSLRAPPGAPPRSAQRVRHRRRPRPRPQSRAQGVAKRCARAQLCEAASSAATTAVATAAGEGAAWLVSQLRGGGSPDRAASAMSRCGGEGAAATQALPGAVRFTVGGRK